MAHTSEMRGPVTVVELPAFQKRASRLWDHDERDRMIDFIARNPEAGDLIPGAGGIRKLRRQRPGIGGKRGGARVAYFYHDPAMPIFLLLAYAKARQEDMTADEKRQTAMIVTALKRQYGLEARNR
jgi:hypothetical protein